METGTLGTAARPHQLTATHRMPRAQRDWPMTTPVDPDDEAADRRTGTERRTRALLTHGKRMGIIGVVLLVVGVAILTSGVFPSSADLTDARDRLDIEVDVPGQVELDLETGSYAVVAIGTGLTADVGAERDEGKDDSRVERVPFVEPTVVITAPGGSRVAMQPPRSPFTVSTPDFDLVSLRSFQVETVGTYRIEVLGESSRVSSVGIGPSDLTDGGTSVGTIVGGVLFGIGLVLSLVGLRLFVIGLRRRRQDAAALAAMDAGDTTPDWIPPAESGPPTGPIS